jgi:hypothetical protein
MLVLYALNHTFPIEYSKSALQTNELHYTKDVYDKSLITLSAEVLFTHKTWTVEDLEIF